MAACCEASWLATAKAAAASAMVWSDVEASLPLPFFFGADSSLVESGVEDEAATCDEAASSEAAAVVAGAESEEEDEEDEEESLRVVVVLAEALADPLPEPLVWVDALDEVGTVAAGGV